MNLRVMYLILVRIAFCVCVLISFQAFGQQDSQYTQYMYNTMSVNPAYAGSRGKLSAAILYRSQWIGIKGAPETQTFNVHSPIDENLGLGLSVVNDNIGNGTVSETNIDLNLSYTIAVGEKQKMSFGLKAGGHILNINPTKLAGYQNFSEETDFQGIDHKFSPNIGAGVYYHTQKFYAGISVPNLLEIQHFENSPNTGNVSYEKMNLYFISGYVHHFSKDLKFKPAALLKMVSGSPLQVDLSTNFMYKEKFILGAGYRWNGTFSVLTGFNIAPNFLIGLAMDKETTALGNTSFDNSSFEILLRYELLKKVDKLITPRFF